MLMILLKKIFTMMKTSMRMKAINNQENKVIKSNNNSRLKLAKNNQYLNLNQRQRSI